MLCDWYQFNLKLNISQLNEAVQNLICPYPSLSRVQKSGLRVVVMGIYQTKHHHLGLSLSFALGADARLLRGQLTEDRWRVVSIFPSNDRIRSLFYVRVRPCRQECSYHRRHWLRHRAGLDSGCRPEVSGWAPRLLANSSVLRRPYETTRQRQTSKRYRLISIWVWHLYSYTPSIRLRRNVCMALI